MAAVLAIWPAIAVANSVVCAFSMIEPGTATERVGRFLVALPIVLLGEVLAAFLQMAIHIQLAIFYLLRKMAQMIERTKSIECRTRLQACTIDTALKCKGERKVH
jgi:hypothetical protein